MGTSSRRDGARDGVGMHGSVDGSDGASRPTAVDDPPHPPPRGTPPPFTAARPTATPALASSGAPALGATVQALSAVVQPTPTPAFFGEVQQAPPLRILV